MGANRKLQQEIDRTLKKVTEGIDVFDEIWNKVTRTRCSPFEPLACLRYGMSNQLTALALQQQYSFCCILAAQQESLCSAGLRSRQRRPSEGEV
jgi:hypothetical protein